MNIEIKSETHRQELIQLEIEHLEENWNRFAEWDAEQRHRELGALEAGAKPSHSYYKELHPKVLKIKLEAQPAPEPRRIPNPEGGKTYATEKNAVRAASSLEVDARYLVVRADSPRFQDGGWRVIFIVHNADEIGALLGTGHQIIN